MASGKGVKPYDPLKVEKTDHPDLVGGVIWADCELEWIRAYGTRCYNHGNAKGMEAGRLLFEEPKVGCAGTAVTREMITAAHGVTLKTGDVVLSARLLESIYLAMDAVRHNAKVSGDGTASAGLPGYAGDIGE